MSLDVRMLTVGAVQENTFLVRKPDGNEAVSIDPGDEAPRLLATLEDMGASLAGILLTHTHFDHVGAVAELARATGAQVWCPEIEVPILADLNSYMAFRGLGPFESYDADHAVTGGQSIHLAGLTFDVVFTPGHSPGHVTYSVRDELALFSGDVLFEGSVGRTDLPFGDWPTLQASIALLLARFPDESRVYPGHMGVTTLGQERATNPFLEDLPAPAG